MRHVHAAVKPGLLPPLCMALCCSLLCPASLSKKREEERRREAHYYLLYLLLPACTVCLLFLKRNMTAAAAWHEIRLIAESSFGEEGYVTDVELEGVVILCGENHSILYL